MTTCAIDVVILTWNDGDDARRAIDSALASEDVEVRVWVVDNASDDAFQDRSNDPRVRVDRQSVNLGVAGGRNHGLRLGTAPYVCILDSDAELSPPSLARMILPFQEAEDVGVAGPVFDGHAPEQTGGVAPSLARKLARGFGLTDRYRSSGTRGPWFDVDFVIGACQVLRRRAWNDVGPLDDSYRFGPEDVDMCLRMRAAGWRVVQVNGAAVRHDARRGFRNPLSRRGLAHLRALLRHYRVTGLSGRRARG